MKKIIEFIVVAAAFCSTGCEEREAWWEGGLPEFEARVYIYS
jgi:hypothetical protein